MKLVFFIFALFFSFLLLGCTSPGAGDGIDNNTNFRPAAGASVCALTPEVVIQTCNIVPAETVRLFSRVYFGDCEVLAEAQRSDKYGVVIFNVEAENQTLSEFRQLYDVSTIYEPVTGVGDAAYLFRKHDNENGFNIIFHVGNKTGKLEIPSDEIEYYDIVEKMVYPIGGGCNEEEAKELVKNVLVPYMRRG